MRISIVLVFCSIALASAATRKKRAAYDLPDGVQLIVGSVRTSFACSNEGYYADIDNNCQIFHVCQIISQPNEPPRMEQWSFMCGNQTVFNQGSFTCAWPEDAVECSRSADFFYLNANLGAGPDVPFLTDDDVQRANAVTPGRGHSGGAPPPPPRGGGGGRFGG